MAIGISGSIFLEKKQKQISRKKIIKAKQKKRESTDKM